MSDTIDKLKSEIGKRLKNLDDDELVNIAEYLGYELDVFEFEHLEYVTVEDLMPVLEERRAKILLHEFKKSELDVTDDDMNEAIEEELGSCQQLYSSSLKKPQFFSWLRHLFRRVKTLFSVKSKYVDLAAIGDDEITKPVKESVKNVVRRLKVKKSALNGTIAVVAERILKKLMDQISDVPEWIIEKFKKHHEKFKLVFGTLGILIQIISLSLACCCV